MKKWCKIFEVDGNQVLVTNTLNSDNDKFEIRVAVQGDDFFKDSGLSEVAVVIGNSEKPFPDDFIEGLPDLRVTDLVKQSLLPTVQQILDAKGDEK